MKRNYDPIPILAGAAAVVLCAGGLVSCGTATSSNENASREQIIALSEGEGALAIEKRFLVSKDDMQMTEAGTLAGGGKRSQYEGRKQVQFGGKWQGENYNAPGYERKSWWGKRKADVKVYDGGKDGGRFQTESRFSEVAAGADGKKSRFDGSEARRDEFDAGEAHEVGKTVDKPVDAHTQWRRDVTPEPRIMSKREYEQHTIEQTRAMLGRDD